MKTYTNECVSCGLPCLGDSCPNRHVPKYYCDGCEEEFPPRELFDVGGEDLCMKCAAKQIGNMLKQPDNEYDPEDMIRKEYKTLD